MDSTDELYEKAKKVYKDTKKSVKESIAKRVAKAEENIQNRKGIEGNLVNIVDKAIAKAKTTNKSVQERGGYLTVARDTLDNTVDGLEKFYKSIDDSLFTNGKFDKEKAKLLANDGKALIEKYGKKAGQTIYYITKTVSDKVQKNYRELVSTKEERDTIYKGIGTRYSGILLKPNYENCLKFYEHAKNAIPKNTKYRRVILKDIKASASADVIDLRDFYKYVEDVRVIAPKRGVVNRYLYKYILD
ncbi:MAG: hypothetical protein ACP5N1_00570 [Candidatus Woesearchaeota archaeon]